MSVTDVFPIGQAYRSLIRRVDLQPSMLVSNGSPMGHVSLRWGMSVSDGSPMKYVEVSDQAYWSWMGLLLSMSV